MPPRPAHEPDQQADEEDGRPEPEQQVLPPRPALVERLRVHRHALLLEQLRQRLRVRELGDLRLELRRRLRVLVALRLRERALDGGALRGDLGDVAGVHLLQEERAVRHAHPRGGLCRPRARPVVDDQQGRQNREPRAEARPAEVTAAAGPAGGPALRLRSIRRLLGLSTGRSIRPRIACRTPRPLPRRQTDLEVTP